MVEVGSILITWQLDWLERFLAVLEYRGMISLVEQATPLHTDNLLASLSESQ